MPHDTKLATEGDAAIEDLPAYKVAWIYQKGYAIIDAPREVYIKKGKGIPPEEWITEIQFPIKE